MRTVNQATQTAWSQISYTKIRVYLPSLSMSIDDSNIGSIKFTESISDTDNLFFVGCIASGIELTLNNFTTDIHLNAIEVYVQKGTTTELKIFTGKVYTADLDGRNNTMKVVAYDALYRIFNADVTTWYDELALPMTMKSFRDAFFLHFGITQKATTLLNDDFVVDRTIGGEQGNQGILGRDIIRPLCEANVCFGHIDYDGDFVYINLSEDNRTVALAEVSAMTKADYVTNAIDKVIVRMDEEDIGAVYGYGSNAYIIEGNMFFYGLSALALGDVAEDIYNAIEGFSFQPLESEQMFNPIYELGDKITVPDGFGNTYQTYILNRTTDLEREQIKSKGLSEYSQSASYSNNSIIALMGKANRLYRDIETTRSTITDVAAGLQTEITQTAEGLQIQIQDLQEQIDGEVAYYERESGAPTLLNYPYWDFTTSIPCNNTIRTADIYTENMGSDGDQYPHFTYTEKNRKDHRSDLCYVDDTNLGYRFVLENGVWYWKEIADSDFTQVLSRIATLEATAEQLTSEYSELSITLSDGYYTKVQTDSKISQSASQIQTTVAATYATKTTTDSLQSQITQTASSITSEVTRATTAEGNLSSRITQNANAITAKVSSSGGSSSSFAWELNTTNFRLLSNNTEVMKCNSSGLYVTGNIVGSNISGGTISGVELRGNVTMASTSSFTQLYATRATISTAINLPSVSNVYISGSGTLQKKSGSTFYAPQYAYPTLTYSSELRGYVPVFSSATSWQQFKAPTNIDASIYGFLMA